MVSKKRPVIVAWLYFGLITVFVVAGIALNFVTQPDNYGLTPPELLLPLVLVAFALVGALIVSRQPQNVVGLLLMLPGTSLVVFVDAYLAGFINGVWPVPEPPTLPFLLLLWFSNWSWLLLVFPLVFILVLFPNGRFVTKRWRWLLYVGVGLMLLIVGMATFSTQITTNDGVSLAFDNPIGFIDIAWLDENILPIFFVILPIWLVLCVASLFVRFRRAGSVERGQIKWLFLAGGLFALSYVPPFFYETYADVESLWNVAWLLGMLTIPMAIAVAILRYGLYDIDLIIRRTMQYGVITAVLALIYFGTIILLQSLVGQAAGEQSPLAIVLSTLLIAALFNPLRQRVQTFIDRRFYRQKYDAQQVLAQFAQTARDEVEMEALQAELLRVVQETMQPQTITIWVKPTEN